MFSSLEFKKPRDRNSGEDGVDNLLNSIRTARRHSRTLHNNRRGLSDVGYRGWEHINIHFKDVESFISSEAMKLKHVVFHDNNYK